MTDEPFDPSEGAPDQISRRRMLKRIGVAGAIAWATPVVTSLNAPAFAQVVSPGGCPCFEDCGSGEFDCFCVTSVEGDEFCSNNFFCGATPACETSAECPEGWVCQGPPCQGTCGFVCVPPCGTTPDGFAEGARAQMNR